MLVSDKEIELITRWYDIVNEIGYDLSEEEDDLYFKLLNEIAIVFEL